MTTWAENLARTDRTWLAYATVQGIGDGDGLWRFSTASGWTLSGTQGSWRPWLSRPPSLMSSRVPYVDGGTTEDSGSCTLEVIDVGEALTQLLRVDTPPQSVLTVQATAAATSLSVPVGHGFSTNDVVWLGAEAVLVTGTSASSLTVTRAYLDTTATAHAEAAPLYANPNVLRSREMRVYLAPLDGAESDAQLVAVYTLDSLAFDETHTRWVFEGELREPYLMRMTPRKPFRIDVERVVYRNANNDSNLYGFDLGDMTGQDEWPAGAEQFRTISIAEESGDEGSEVYRIFVREDTRPGFHSIAKRGEALSKLEDEPVTGPFVRVLSVPNHDFRASTNGGSTAGRTASWAKVDHVVDILLCLLTSSAVEEDGLQFTNIFSSPQTENFSGLPVGYGLGVPVSRIDFSSFLEVRERLPEALLPNFVLGPEARPAHEVITEDLLRPFGIILTSEAGSIVLRLPRLPTNDEVGVVTADTSVILSSKSGTNNRLPRVEVERDISNRTQSIHYKLGRNEENLTVNWADFKTLFNPLDLYETEGETREVPVTGADPSNDQPFRDAAKRKLWQTFRPPTLIRMDVDASLWEWRLTAKADVTLPGVVNPASGSRGFSNASAQLIEREEMMDVTGGVVLRTVAHLTPTLRVGRISPSADVASVSTNTATVEANRYTSADAVGRPSSDAAAFTVGDVVRLVDSSGVDVGAGTQVVSSIGVNSLTLDGNFSGNLAANTTIVYANASESTTTQRGRYVYMADLATFAITGVSDDPWQYGIP